MIQVCVGEDLAIGIADLRFHGQWHVFQVCCQLPCAGGFACLGSHRSSLANRMGTSFKVVVARLKNCSSSLLWSFGPFEPRCLQQQCLRKNCNFGTATSYHELRVLNRYCAAQKSEAAKL